MSEEGLSQFNPVKLANESPSSSSLGSEVTEKSKASRQAKPLNQLGNGLLGWYAAYSSSSLKEGDLYYFSMYNEPLIIYRDKNLVARCIKDMCPHRGSSFS